MTYQTNIFEMMEQAKETKNQTSSVFEIIEMEVSDNLAVVEEELKGLNHDLCISNLRLGKILYYTKKRDITHGEWLLWLDKNGISHALAQKSMKVYKVIMEDSETVKDWGIEDIVKIGFTKLHLLTKLPKSKRWEMVKKEGKEVFPHEMSVSELRAYIKETKADDKKESPKKDLKKELEDLQEMNDRLKCQLNNVNTLENAIEVIAEKASTMNKEDLQKLVDNLMTLL